MNNTDPAQEAGELLRKLSEQADERQDAIDEAYLLLRDRGWIARVRVRRYMCRRGCQIATAFKAGQAVLLAVRDYKQSPGLNAVQSVPEARANNTLDGDRWWPSHVYDMTHLATWGDAAGASVACRHYRGMLTGAQVLADVEGVRPGHDGKPSILGVSNDA